MSNLPRPVTTQDYYLAALLDEIKGLRDDLKQPSETAVSDDGLVDIREPAPVGTPIPDGFPGRAKLIAAGIDTTEAIPRDGDSLVEIDGIGTATAGQILAELS